MAIYCIDYLNGSNVTGDGTSSLPWATLEYAILNTTKVAGDEFRIHAGLTPTLLDSACTQNAVPSTSTSTIFTSVDLTGSLTVGDWIFVGDNISDFPIMFKIATISSTQITVLSGNFSYLGAIPRFSADGSTPFSIWSAGGVAITINTSGEAFTIRETPFPAASPFAEFSDSITVSGGWADGFATKTALGKTIFYRIGSYQSTTVTSQFILWRWASNGINGYLFKDFQNAGGDIFNTSSTTGNILGANFDGLTLNGASNGRFTNGGNVSSVNTQNHYFKNWSLLYDQTVTNNTYSFYSSYQDSTLDVQYDYTGGTMYHTCIASNTGSNFFNTATNNGAGVYPNFTGITHNNFYNPIFWNAPTNRRPALAFNMGRPTIAMPGFSNVQGSAFLDGQVVLHDNLTINGYDMVVANKSTTSGSFGSVLLKLSAANLAKIWSLGGIANAQGRYGRFFIEAPADPNSLTCGSAYDPDDDTANMIMITPPESNIWYNTTTGKKYYLSTSTITEIDTVDYVTGSNALKLRPGAIGSQGSIYGPYIKVADFRLERTQTATITVKMKVSGVASANNVGVKYLSLGYYENFNALNAGVTGTNILAAAETYTVTDAWADYTFTCNLSNYFAGFPIDYIDDWYLPTMTVHVGCGDSGSPLAEAGRYLHIDSVSISII